jgi:hypothetical protein
VSTKNLIGYIAILLFILVLTFYAAANAKRFSYWFWYEDLVRETIREELLKEVE